MTTINDFKQAFRRLIGKANKGDYDRTRQQVEQIIADIEGWGGDVSGLRQALKDAEKALDGEGTNAGFTILAEAETKGREQSGQETETGEQEFARQRNSAVDAQKRAEKKIGSVGPEAKVHAKLYTNPIKPIETADDMLANGQGGDALRLLDNIVAGYAAAAAGAQSYQGVIDKKTETENRLTAVADRATKETVALDVDAEQQKIDPAVALAKDGKYDAALAALAAIDKASEALDKQIDDVILERKKDFETEFNNITKYADAARAAANPPVKKLLTEVADFKKADKDVSDKKGREEWGPAKVAVPALALAANALADGKKEFDDKKAEFEGAWNGMADRVKAEAIIAAATPAKIGTEVTTYKEKKKIVTDAQADEEWGTAKTGVDAMQKAAKALVDAKKDYDDKKAEFEVAWNGMTDYAAADTFATSGPAKAKAVLDAKVKEFTAAKKVVTEAQAAEEWKTAKDNVGALQKAAKALLTAKTAYEGAKVEFDNAWPGVANYTPAETICWTKPMPGKLPPEVGEFKKADITLDTAVRAEDWATARDVLPALKAAIAKLVPAFNDWKPFAHAHEANLYILEKARVIAAAAPAKLNAQKTAFEPEDGKIGPAVTSKKWGDALAAVNLATPAAKLLIAAQEQYDKDKKPFDDAVKAAQADYEKAKAVFAALPGALATNPKVIAFKDAEKAVEDARKDEKWTEGVAAADTLKTRSQELVGATAEFNTAFTEEDAKDIPDKLKALESETKKAGDPPAAPFIDPLQKTVGDLVIEIKGQITAKDYVAAATGYEKLLAAIAARKKAKEEFNVFKLAFDAVLNGEDKDARAKGTDPAAVANLRNATLDKLKLDAKTVGDTGKLPVATKKVAVWKEQAKGWIEGWADAIEAHAALSDPAPDENKLKDLAGKLKTLAGKPGGGKVIDEMVRALGPNPSRAVMKTVMKERFGVEIDLKKFQLRKDDTGTVVYEDPPANTKPVYDKIDDPMAKGSKSVKKLYEMMTEIPEEFVANSPSLKKIVRVGGRVGLGSTPAQQKEAKTGGSFYRSSEQLVVLECGRQSMTGGTTIGNTTELPDVTDELYQPAGGSDQEMSYFDWTTYHEIGHAVDDRKGFMAANGAKPDFGGWVRYGSNIAPIAEAIQGDSRFKAGGKPYNLDYIKKLLNGAAGFRPPALERPGPTGGATPADWAKARLAIEAWVDAVRKGQNLWDSGGGSKAQAIGGRVYHEAYDGDWYSYDVAARSKGISGYQFRAPGEFFAELYAAYYSDALKPGHPFAKVVESL